MSHALLFIALLYLLSLAVFVYEVVRAPVCDEAGRPLLPQPLRGARVTAARRPKVRSAAARPFGLLRPTTGGRV
ncbi:hypothetical protein [Synoicihabitans lomoniglobus]|uniref:Uncharacterized protein n=1 Tax=Synoicihabitans lomoniglobus TaxID=2909285 RepID=A0AAE9ZVG1_9BACT|nr:hypothetical protein [Opitutaceae bacterium LMO-M01]WED64876.1 hypothetical protein PXH66_21225 [Opitutaceae bacterium LMO-M01]